VDSARWKRWPITCWPFALYLGLTLVLTWPQARDLDFALPGTAEGAVSQDPLLNAWTLAQAAENVKSPDRGLFHSNAFWPRQLTLSYSDHLLGWLPLALPLSLLTDNYALIVNLLYFVSFVLAALGAYWLIREVTGSQVAAAVGGAIFAFCPFRMTQFGHFAGISCHWVPFALLFVYRYLRKPRAWYAAAAVLFVFLQTLTSGIYGIYFCIYLGLFLLARALWRRAFSWRQVLWLGLCGIILSGLLLPFYWPNIVLQREMGFSRTTEEHVRLAADVLTIFGIPENNLYRFIFRGLPPGEGMFPGLLVLVLAGYGLARGWRRGGADREFAFLLLLCAGASWLLSLGPVIKFNARPLVPGPYAVLMKVLPGLGVLRMSTRFGAFMMLSLTILAGLGIREWLATRAGRERLHVALMSLILLLEYAAVPRPLGLAPDGNGVPEVYRWLRDQPADTVAIEVPYTHGYPDAFAMYHSIYHGKRILNGYSSYTPPEGKIAVLGLSGFPSPDSIGLLRATGADVAVVHQEIIESVLGRPMAQVPAQLKPIQEFGPDKVYAIRDESPPDPAEGLTDLAPAQFAIAATHEPELARALSTPRGRAWPAAGFVDPATTLQVRLADAEQIVAVELQFDPVADLSPCWFVLSSSVDGAIWHRLEAKHLLPQFYLSARNRPRGPSLFLRLPEGRYRHLALAPDLAAGTRAWPLTHIRLWKAAP